MRFWFSPVETTVLFPGWGSPTCHFVFATCAVLCRADGLSSSYSLRTVARHAPRPSLRLAGRRSEYRVARSARPDRSVRAVQRAAMAGAWEVLKPGAVVASYKGEEERCVRGAAPAAPGSSA
jgi:hypothetical protein